MTIQTIRVSKFRVALYGVLADGDKVLMTETKIPSGSTMNFPGGGLELGEDPIEAVSREFREETGIEVGNLELLYCTRKFRQNPDFPAEQLMHIYYKVTRTSGTMATTGNNDDVLSLRWVTLNEIESLDVMPVDREFIESAPFRALFC